MSVSTCPIILQPGQTSHVYGLASYAVGTYTKLIQSNSNALLSSLLVLGLGAGATVTVNYFQTTAADESQERTPIVSHTVTTVTNTEANTILVRNIHSKVYAELIVAGGSAMLGLVATSVESFATLGDKPTGSLRFSKDHDTVTVEYPTTKTEIFNARVGGVTGTIVETVTVVYEDDPKEMLLSAVRA